MNNYNPNLRAAEAYPGMPWPLRYDHPNEYYPDIYHTRPNHATAPPNFVALLSRVATLEGQLAHARAEEDRADKTIQYFLRLQVNSANNDAGSADPDQTLTTLRRKLVRAKEENRTLKATLRLILDLLKNNAGPLSAPGVRAGPSPSENVAESPRPAEPQSTEDLIDLYSLGEPTDVNPSEHDSASSNEAEEEGTSKSEAYNDNHNKAEKLDSCNPIDLSQTQYVFRFGHRGGSGAPATDSRRDQIPGDYEEIDEEVSSVNSTNTGHWLNTH